MAADRDAPSPSEQVARLYEQTESEAAKATERLVGSGGFAALLGQLAENAAALTKLSSGALDLTLRNLRLAGRRDIIRLSRQLARTEDKLERVLQEVEAVRDQLAPGTDGRPLIPPAASGSRVGGGAGAGAAAQTGPAPPARRGGTRSPRRSPAPDNGASSTPAPPAARKSSR